MRFYKIFIIVFSIILHAANLILASDQIIDLTLDSAVDIAMNNSYRTKMLQLEIEESMYWLKARKAGLKTQIYMNLQTPDLQQISDYKWNSVLYKNEIVRENSQLWQSDLAIKQPVILLGYPTNGFLSLNYTVNKYQQKDGEVITDYYNRLYLKFEQPFLLPNELKNDLEEAELNLRDIKLRFISQRMELLRSIGDDYYEIFEEAYNGIVCDKQLQFLREIEQRIQAIYQHDETRKSDLTQIQLEIGNELENKLSAKSSLRQEFSDIKQRLQLNRSDSLMINPVIELKPINVKLNDAIQYGYKNSPELQRLDIYKRRAEIGVDNQKGQNAFHLSLEITYGLEKQNDHLSTLWERFDNSNSITLNAYVPVWDGGQRKARIQAEMMNLKQRELEIDHEEIDVKNDVTNNYTNLKDYYDRGVNLQKSLNLSGEIIQTSIEDYERKQISVQDLLQILNRHKKTEMNLLDVYLGYRRSLVNLMYFTYYDFEKNLPLLEGLGNNFSR